MSSILDAFGSGCTPGVVVRCAETRQGMTGMIRGNTEDRLDERFKERFVASLKAP